MKRLLIAVLLLACWVPAQADQKPLAGKPVDILMQWVPWPSGVTFRTDAADSAWLVDTSLISSDSTYYHVADYWNGGKIAITDVSSNLTDSTRIISDFSDTLRWTPNFSIAVAAGDSFQLYLPITRGETRHYAPVGWVLRDSAVVDTSEIFYMTPGASITSEHLIENGSNKDSVDTKIVLQTAMTSGLSNNGGWYRNDSITYTSQDTVVYKAWGAKQATMFRFIYDPVEAPFVNGVAKTNTVYGKVMVDKDWRENEK